MSAGDDRPVAVGVAGLGRSGWNLHIETIRPMKDKFKVVAVTDPNQERCRQAKEEFQCRIHDDVESLVADREVEAVVVATLNHQHCRHSVAALKAGKDVICEKPMATSLSDADRMIEVSREAGKVLTIFQNRRYEPSFLKVREVIESGKLGRIVMIKIYAHGFARRWDWQTLREFDGGSLNNTGPHHMDHALELFGDAEPEIFCHMERALTSGDAEDHVKVILRGENSPMIDLEITSACAYPQNQWLVMGSQGGLSGTTQKLQWKYVDFSKLPARPVDRNPTPGRTYNSEELPWQEETWENTGDLISDMTRFYDDVYEALRHGAAVVVTPESIRRQIAVLEKCHELCPV